MRINTLSLRQQLLILMLFCVALFTVIITAIITNYEKAAALQELSSSMAAESLVKNKQVARIFDKYRRDLHFYADLAISKRIAIREYFNPSPANNKAQQADKKELEDIFYQYVDVHEKLMQIRLIGVQGKELARVNREGDEVSIVPTITLQDKSHREYFLETTKLSAGEIYVSDINLNREFGKIQIPLQPTIRLSTPVFNDRQFMVGMIVVNINVNDIFDIVKLHSSVSYENTVYITNQAGDYLSNPDPGKDFGFEYGRNLRWNTDFLLSSSISDQLSVYSYQNELYYVHEKHFPVINNKDAFILYIAVNTKTLDAAVKSRLNRSLLLLYSFSLIVVIFLLSYLRRVLKPIALLTKASESFGRGQRSSFIPSTGSKEMDTLISTFNKMQLDIEEREQGNQKLAKQLAKREEQANKIFEAAPEALVIVDSEGRLQKANAFFEQMFGYSASEYVGKKVEILIPESRRNEHIAMRNNHGNVNSTLGIDRDLIAMRKNGDKFAIILCLSAIEMDGENYFIAGIRDINDRVLAEKKAKQYQRALEISNNDLLNFAYIATHDLKAPLRGIKQIAGWIKDDLGDNLDATMQGHLDTIQSRTSQLSKLLDDLLTYSKLEDLENKISTINIEELVHKTWGLLSPLSTFTLHYDSSIDTIVTPHAPFELVIRNLLSNAILHHHQRTGTIAVHVSADNEYYKIVISDDGPGIEPAQQDKIFQLFKAIHANDKVVANISGMGLAMVKKIVGLHGGSIELESNPGKGSSFTVYWPIDISAFRETQAQTAT